MLAIFEDDFAKVVLQAHENPWVIVFVKSEVKEFSYLGYENRDRLMQMVYAVEKSMIEYYTPDKINIASFGNYVPKLHMHIQARFKEDNYFPEPLWGVKHKESFEVSKDFEGFAKRVKEGLEKL